MTSLKYLTSRYDLVSENSATRKDWRNTPSGRISMGTGVKKDTIHSSHRSEFKIYLYKKKTRA